MEQAAASGSRELFTNSVAGFILGLNEIVAEISLAILIFSGALAPFAPNGITFLLIGSVIAMLITAVSSSFKGMISPCEDIPAAILAVIAAGIAASLDGRASQEELFATVVAAIFIVTIVTGIIFILLGRFRLGTLFRFLPYPVVGGFLAGTGWLLAIGGLGVMVPLPDSLGGVPGLFDPNILTFWLPGVLFAVALYFILNRWSHFLVFPAVLLAAAVAFYGIALASGNGPAALEEGGYLLGRFPEGQLSALLLPIYTPEGLAAVHWSAIFEQTGNMLAVVVLSAIALLLNASGIELFVKQDLDLNQELVAAGFGSLGSGLAGGIVTYPAVGITSLGYSLGGRGRILPLITSALTLVILIFGTPILAIIPKFIFGGLLSYLGVELLMEWLVKGRGRFSVVEYVILIAILITIATIGFLEGVVLGLFLAVGLFVYNYSRVSVVKHAVTGGEFGSLVTRQPSHRRALAGVADQISIFRLQGYLFFGTAHGLLQQIREKINVDGIQYLVLDFDQVTGLDSTALLSFNKLIQVTEQNGIALIFAPPPDSRSVGQVLNHFFEGLKGQAHDHIHLFSTLDKGLEWCENQLLITQGIDPLEEVHPLLASLGPLLPKDFDLDTILACFERLEVETGFYLMRQGVPAQAMYFIASGQVTAQLEPADRDPVRLETMRGGRIVGEIGFYLDQPRTASVVADEPSVIYRLTRDKLQTMETEVPHIASALHQVVLRLVSERMTHLISTVEALKK